ncbi:hypothetical protein AB0J90_28655 [Micromonospora sp. NPDC049523]|uniref:hypothetical protein n=1 Tax=Micromonospora sp. NPDC049523 TaxID=3155921 RepID=UPI00341F28F4
MNDVEKLLTESLRNSADGEVDGMVLLERATTRGRKFRRRHRAWMGAGLAVVAAVAAGGVIGGTHLWPVSGNGNGNGFDVAVGGQPGARPATALPEVAGEQGASVNPARVGADVNLIHFDATAITSTARHYTWTSGKGYEQLAAGVGTEDLIYAEIGPDMGVLDGVERQNDLGVVVREQPVPGLWLRVQATDEKLARQIVGAIELDRVQRIVLPFQLTGLPAGASVVRSAVGFDDGVYTDGGVVLERDGNKRMEIQAQYAPGQGNDSARANHVAGGRQAFLYPGQDEIELLGLRNLELSARIGKAYQGFTVADADLALGGVNVAADVTAMSTWPKTLTS